MVVLASAAWDERWEAEAVVGVAAAELVLEGPEAVEAEGAGYAEELDPDFQAQMESVTDSSSELMAVAEGEVGCSVGHSGAKPGSWHVALPYAEPLPVGSSAVLPEPEGLGDAEFAAVAAAVVAGLAVAAVPAEQPLPVVDASVESVSCAGVVGSPFEHFGSWDCSASGRIAEGSCPVARSCPLTCPYHSSAAVVAAVAGPDVAP